MEVEHYNLLSHLLRGNYLPGIIKPFIESERRNNTTMGKKETKTWIIKKLGGYTPEEYDQVWTAWETQKRTVNTLRARIFRVKKMFEDMGAHQTLTDDHIMTVLRGGKETKK